jgi:SAM-dependent methyltransferase
MFAQLYHAHHSRHIEDLPFWLDLAGRQGGPILELGCGAGRVLLALAKAGSIAFGLDRDAAMLALLQQHAGPWLVSRCPVFLADMSAFHLAQQFPLILLPCNTLSALPSTIRSAMLRLVRSHLSPGGLFAASMPNPALLARLPRRAEPEVEEIFPHPVDGEPVQVSSTWQRDGQHFIASWHYDHLLPDGRVERFDIQVSHDLQSVDHYIGELNQAGLRLESSFGDFDGSIFTKESPNLILLARPGA